MTAVMLMGLVGASLWSNARLRAINQRLEGGDRPVRSLRAGGAGPGAAVRAARDRRAAPTGRPGDRRRPARAGPGDPPRHPDERRPRGPALVRLAIPLAPGSPRGRGAGRPHAATSAGWRSRRTGRSSPRPIRPTGSGPPGCRHRGRRSARSHRGPTRSGGRPSRRTVRSSRRSRRPPAPPRRTGSRSGRSRRVAGWLDCRSTAGSDGCRCGFLPGGSSPGHRLRPRVRCRPTFASALGPGATIRAHPRLVERFDAMPAAWIDWNGGDLLTPRIPGDGHAPGRPSRASDGPSLRHRRSEPGASSRRPARRARSSSPPCRSPSGD